MDTPLDLILAHTLPGGRAVARLVRKRLLPVAREARYRGTAAALALARAELAKVLPVYAAAVRDSLLAAWLAAAAATAEPAYGIARRPPPRWGGPPRPALSSGDDSPLKLVLIENASRWLEERNAVSRQNLLLLAREAQRAGVEVAEIGVGTAAAELKAAVEDAVYRGTGKDEFRAAVAGAVEAGRLGANHVETLFRTNVGRAYAAGQLMLLADRIVQSSTPYAVWSATHDSRVRKHHLSMEHSGMLLADGTRGPVYRIDDPVLLRLWPPFEWNCRCIVTPVGVHDAADRGVREAIVWRRTGRPPLGPEHVPDPGFALPANWVPVAAGGLNPVA